MVNIVTLYEHYHLAAKPSARSEVGPDRSFNMNDNPDWFRILSKSFEIFLSNADDKQLDKVDVTMFLRHNSRNVYHIKSIN